MFKTKSHRSSMAVPRPLFLILLYVGCLYLGLVSCVSQPRKGDSLQGAKDASSSPDFLESTIPFAELEEIDGKIALQWVSERNKESAEVLESDALYHEIKSEVLEILDAKDRIPSITIRSRGAEVQVDNFWQGPDNVKGIYRRQSLADYKSKLENWETLIDIDQIAREEKVDWVFKGLVCAPIRQERCLLMLSKGGGDAVLTREYDLISKKFVPDGFVVPEGKVRLAWRDDDSIWLGAEHGAGTLSQSGYPVTVRVWTRGEPIEQSKEVFRGEISDVAVGANTMREWTPDGDRSVHVINRALTFYQNEIFLQNPAGKWIKIPVPPETDVEGLANGRLILTFKKPGMVLGRKVKSGGVYAVDFRRLQNAEGVRLEQIFEPNSKQAYGRVGVTRNAVLIAYLDNVVGRLMKAELKLKDGGRTADWRLEPVRVPGSKGTLSLAFTRYDESLFTIFYSDFLTPHRMFLLGESSSPELLRTTPYRFNSNGMKVESRFVKSRDGVRVPYFVVFPKATPDVMRAMKESRLPTLVYGYGGFEIPSVPTYMGATGKVWLERGGA